MTFEFYCNTCRDKKHYIQGHRAFCADCEDHLGDTEKLEAQNKIMRSALEFYANGKCAETRNFDTYDCNKAGAPQIGYKQAQQALEKVKELDEK